MTLESDEIKRKLDTYRPEYTICAEQMPPLNRVKYILKEIKKISKDWDVKDWDIIWSQAQYRTWDQAYEMLGEIAWDEAIDMGEIYSWGKDLLGIRTVVKESTERDVLGQVNDQIAFIQWMMLIEVLGLEINLNHPARELLKLGIVVIHEDNMFKVFGRRGKELGRFSENLKISNNHLQPKEKEQNVR